MVMGVNFVARRRKKPRATKFFGMGNAYISEWATKFKTTGNEIYRNGQRYFYTNPFVFSQKASISNFFFAAHNIYMRMQKKKSISDSRAVPQKAFFLQQNWQKKLHSVRRLLDGEEGSERMKNEKGCLFERNSL